MKHSVKDLSAGRLAVILFGCLVFLAVSGSAFADDGPVQTQHPLTVGVPESFPPYYQLDEDGRPSGFAVAVMDEVAKRAGFRITYRVAINGAANLKALRAGDIDIIPSLGINDHRKQFVRFTRPVDTFRIVLFVRDDTHGVMGIDDLAGRPIAVVVDNVGYRHLEKRTDIQLKVFPLFTNALFALLSGDVDAFAYPEPVTWKLAREAGVADHIKVAAKPLFEIKRAMAVRKDRVELLAVLDRAVGDFLASPEYQKVYLAWFGMPVPFWTLRKVAVTMGGLFILSLMAMAWWRYRSIISLNRALKESEALFRAVVDHSPTKIHIKDAEGRYTLINPEAEKLFGITDAEGRGKTSHDFFPDRVAEGFMDHDRAVVESGETIEQEEDWQLEDGVHTFLTVKFPIYNSDGVAAVGAIGTDITERKRAEETQLEEERRFRAVFDGSSAAITLKDMDGRFLLVNRTYAAWHDTDPSKMIGREMSDFFPEEQVDHIQTAERKVLETAEESVAEVTRTFEDGVTRTLISSKRPILDAAGEVISVATILTDITERKRAEELSGRFGRIIERSVNEIYVFDAETLKFVSVNRGARQNLGYTMKELSELTPLDVKPEQTSETFAELIRPLSEGGRNQILFETIHKRKDGTTYDVEVRLQLMAQETPPVFVAIVQNITERKQAEEELRQAHDNLNEQIQERTSQLRDEIEERKRIEESLIQTNEQCRLANRAKTDFLANMSHELRTPLNAIIGFSETMMEQTFGPMANDKYEQYAGDIHHSGEHLLALINDILDVSTIEAGKLELHEEEIDPARIIEAAVRLVKDRAKKGQVRLINNAGDDLPLLYGDERRIKQIMLNLLTNAIKFTLRNGEVTIGAGVDGDGWLVITVADTGIGMTEEETIEMLEPFGQGESAISRRHEGTGLGLSVTKGLVEAHGGRIDIKSRVKKGTTVTIRFPADRVIANPADGIVAERKPQ